MLLVVVKKSKQYKVLNKLLFKDSKQVFNELKVNYFVKLIKQKKALATKIFQFYDFIKTLLAEFNFY